MKKKLIAAVLCAALVLGTVLAFVGCGNDLVDTSGNYSAATAEEVNEALKDVDVTSVNTFETIGSFDISGTAIDDEAVNVSTSYELVISTAEDTFKMSGSVKASGSYGDESEETSATLYFDGNDLYMDQDGEKIKTSLELGMSGVMLPTDMNLDFSSYVTDAKAMSMAKQGDTVKLKFEMDASAIFDTMESESSVEVYVVIKDKGFSGIAMKADLMIGKLSTKVDIQMAVSDKSVNPLPDLDDYKTSLLG